MSANATQWPLDARSLGTAQVLTPDERAVFAGAGGIDRALVGIALALHHRVPGVAERTGLSPVLPPDAVHAMSHLPWTTGGDPWYADMIDEALRQAGGELADGQRVLDFGCSSGRVVRMLAARRPGVRWEGVDVNASAIAWASEHLPAITFGAQPLRPPLHLAAGSLDAAYGISIWSHYDAEPALTWLDELHRVIRPGGHLLITTHGPGAVAARASYADHGPAAQAPILEGLYHDGFVFVDAFGQDGDWGVVDSGWGVSFLTPDWLLTQITPRWSLRLYRSRAIADHQDLFVLRREG